MLPDRKTKAGFGEYASTQRLGGQPFIKAAGGYLSSETMSILSDKWFAVVTK